MGKIMAKTEQLMQQEVRQAEIKEVAADVSSSADLDRAATKIAAAFRGKRVRRTIAQRQHDKDMAERLANSPEAIEQQAELLLQTLRTACAEPGDDNDDDDDKGQHQTTEQQQALKQLDEEVEAAQRATQGKNYSQGKELTVQDLKEQLDLVQTKLEDATKSMLDGFAELKARLGD